MVATLTLPRQPHQYHALPPLILSCPLIGWLALPGSERGQDATPFSPPLLLPSLPLSPLLSSLSSPLAARRLRTVDPYHVDAVAQRARGEVAGQAGSVVAAHNWARRGAAAGARKGAPVQVSRGESSRERGEEERGEERRRRGAEVTSWQCHGTISTWHCCGSAATLPRCHATSGSVACSLAHAARRPVGNALGHNVDNVRGAAWCDSGTVALLWHRQRHDTMRAGGAAGHIKWRAQVWPPRRRRDAARASGGSGGAPRRRRRQYNMQGARTQRASVGGPPHALLGGWRACAHPATRIMQGGTEGEWGAHVDGSDADRRAAVRAGGTGVGAQAAAAAAAAGWEGWGSTGQTGTGAAAVVAVAVVVQNESQCVRRAAKTTAATPTAAGWAAAACRPTRRTWTTLAAWRRGRRR